MISMRLNQLMAPAIAAGMLMGFAGVSQAQNFMFTTSNNSSGSFQSTGTSSIFGTGTGATNLFFTNTPDAQPSPATAPSNIVPFRIVPFFTPPATDVAAGTVLTSNFNDTFTLNLTVTNPANNGSGTVTFPGLNFTGALSATRLPTGPNTNGGYSFNDNVNFTLPAADLLPQLVVAGGQSFLVNLVSFTNPGNPAGLTPEGNIGGRITAVPEPGSVAMLVGMGISGAGFLVRRRRSK